MGNTTSSPKITAQDKAILQVKLQKDKLLKYQKKSTLLIKNETNQIKACLSKGDKTSAKIILKRTKYQENLLENVSNQILNLENMIQNIEFKLIEQDFLKGLQNGNEILKKLNNEMKLDQVETLMDDVNENIQIQEEIDQVLSNSIVGKDYEDEIDEELAMLEKEEFMKQGKQSEQSGQQSKDNNELIEKLPSVDKLQDIKQDEEEEKDEEPVKVKQKKTALLA
ncbi:Vacuolar protein sorting-associated protein [Wickerhamomyces ciferrii]|uniref:Vacuolar protein sorting-associated protein n=1 Tax=Wickerhamomyces ciferrii (strain ATCC 14091 / BCRC 22168 / CBS 111 / JCM 3599 / NBRC 0793 / NRRL Y-1031 F-60-10) TaxID=1206466 RepID=K0KUM9_WICCF|nr:Vacuolar protein sorting-associated protein [Wickerhamomyces ciferrii]CCH44883.1 Vacuolar protein sorting-associated protein [Wickerhamomyces ciferrii]